MSRHWTADPELSNTFFLRLIRTIALRQGRGMARLLLYPITLYYLLTAHSLRKASLVFLTRALGRRATYWDVARHIYTFAATLVDRVYLFAGEHERLDVRIHHHEAILDYFRTGRPAILLGSHLGSVEVLRAVGLLDVELPLKILMYKDHNKVITGLLNALNPRFAESVIDMSDPGATLEVYESLGKGYFVGMLGCRPGKSTKVTRCRFMNREVTFPAGPILLAHACKVPIVMCFGLYRGGNRYDIHFELLTERVVLDSEHRERDIQRLMQRFADTLEKHTYQEPFNWFNFYDFWDEYSAGS